MDLEVQYLFLAFRRGSLTLLDLKPSKCHQVLVVFFVFAPTAGHGFVCSSVVYIAFSVYSKLFFLCVIMCTVVCQVKSLSKKSPYCTSLVCELLNTSLASFKNAVSDISKSICRVPTSTNCLPRASLLGLPAKGYRLMLLLIIPGNIISTIRVSRFIFTSCSEGGDLINSLEQLALYLTKAKSNRQKQKLKRNRDEQIHNLLDKSVTGMSKFITYLTKAKNET